VQNALEQLGIAEFIGKLNAKQPVENITESLPAVKLADKISRGQALEFEPYFKTDKENYTWGQRFALSLQSGILKLVMNFMSSERFGALMKKLGINAVSIISERWIAAGPVEWALPQEILARYAEQVFGREHIASYGARLGVTAKHLTSSVPLSIQKHSFAEMIIVQEGEGQKMYVGFKKDVTEEEVLAALRAGTPEEIMNVVENLKPGDVYIIPANMPHAYGAVNVIEVKAVTPEEDKVGTDSFYDRLKLDDEDKLKVTAIISQVSQANIGKSEPEVAQAIADALVAAKLVRNGKDVLTKSNEEVRRIIADIKRAGLLKATNPESLKLAPQVTTSGSSFASVVRTGGFVSERFNIAAGQSLPSSAEALGKPHTLFVTEGSVTWKDSSGNTEPLEAGEERLVPANAKAYTLTAGNGTAVVYSAYKPSAAEALKAIIPNSELAKGRLPGAITSARTEIVLREGSATFERIEVTGEVQVDRWLTGRPVTIKVEKGAGVAIFNSVGKQVATVESGESIDIAADQGGFVIKPAAGETPVVTVTYLHNEEEAATFASIEALRFNLGAIRGKLEGKTLEIRMTKKTADLLYRDGGDANTPGSQAYERAKFAKFMSQYIGADVRIMIRDDWKDLASPSDDKTVPVAWITQDEIQALQGTETLKTIATSFRKMPLSSALMNQMAKSGGLGWSCVMELQANSLLLAATNPEDIKERNDIATSLMRVMNTMIDRPVEAASDLWPLLPAGDNFQLISNFADLIKRLLITRPMTPFRPESELNSRRLLLWSA
jgi:quercetin dioxygenase-like cupin family protein